VQVCAQVDDAEGQVNREVIVWNIVGEGVRPDGTQWDMCEDT
jgi:hypothetical protein